VSTVLSGMSTMQQVVENLDSAERSRVGLLTPGDRAIVARVRDAYRALCPIPCTGCRYCMPCPNGVEIPANFRLLNEGVMYNVLEQRRRHYAGMPESQRASACIACRECETKCPQHILMSEEMPRVQAVLGEGQAYTCRP
jgi:predicted aldo/keto reductase-like oxidoreductase